MPNNLRKPKKNLVIIPEVTYSHLGTLDVCDKFATIVEKKA
jgi:hypothetical protein